MGVMEKFPSPTALLMLVQGYQLADGGGRGGADEKVYLEFQIHILLSYLSGFLIFTCIRKEAVEVFSHSLGSRSQTMIILIFDQILGNNNTR